ncbi:acyltransferase [Mucilaginibacter sp.]|uniref:acyltransferase n=1 Tax=Mucilaginibacter sp. TaxID=1882438 RepID=UPI0025E72270|nr:acyltransferase [Mucilaginibacter sp.]
MDNNIHSLSDVKTDKIGENTFVWQFCVILEGAIIGSNCNINCNCFIENDVILGNNITIKSGVQIWDGISVEDNVFIGPNATFTNDLIPRSKVYPKEFKRTLIKRGASIGANATIVAGIEVGEFSFIGAGSVVTKSVPPYTVWYGNPARHKGFITEDAIILDLNLLDKETNIQYILDEYKPIRK